MLGSNMTDFSGDLSWGGGEDRSSLFVRRWSVVSHAGAPCFRLEYRRCQGVLGRWREGSAGLSVWKGGGKSALQKSENSLHSGQTVKLVAGIGRLFGAAAPSACAPLIEL